MLGKMKEKNLIKESKTLFKEFEEIKPKILGILIYGSFAERIAHSKSDIDVCVVAGINEKEKLKELFSCILRIMGKNERYDIKIFEFMPLYMKAEIIENGKVIYAKSLQELYEYFYFYRKLWQGQAIMRIKE